MKNETGTLLADLKMRIDRIVSTALQEGRNEALAQLRDLVGAAQPARRGPGRPRKYAAAPAAVKPLKKRKNPWAHMTPEQKKERVRKMLAGRGLTPKG